MVTWGSHCGCLAHWAAYVDGVCACVGGWVCVGVYGCGGQLCNDCKFTDSTHCKISLLTRIFHQANAEADEDGSEDNAYNDDSSLHRYEFWDALCRIGVEKFRQEGWPLHVCLENLIVDVVRLALYPHIPPSPSYPSPHRGRL